MATSRLQHLREQVTRHQYQAPTRTEAFVTLKTARIGTETDQQLGFHFCLAREHHRQFPHLQTASGQSTFMSPWQFPSHIPDLIDKLLEDVRQSISDLVSLVPWQSGSSNSSSQLHISLSRAGTWLPRAQLATCVAMIQADLAHQRPVQVQFGRVSHLINDTGSRRFVVLECTAGQVGLARWVRVVDQVLERQLGRKPFYDKPRFHDGSDPDGATRWDELMDRLTLKYGQQLTEFVLKLGRIEVRTGERVYNVDMAE
ncbi:hypothetical protein BCR44DRAFT_1458364 [Catenaria anguillulae PL171]|uniref:U6 snRNA phosphodiesterase 1 n=1 Tax=Catenaria anguillulae PL171 TaxID=765915 RepID=A0A1Y2I0S4_9FUNG|nr:hypothetical protein BCR44DRAFT_1458364 [Catenaria anguillulae PL171]